MRQTLLCSATVLMLTATLQAADKKDTKGDPVDAATQLYPGDVIGTVVSNSGGVLVLRVEFETLQPNGKGGGDNKLNQQLMKQHQELMRAQQNLAKAKNPQQAMQAYRKMMQELQQSAAQQAKGGQQNSFKVVMSHVDYEIELDDSVVYRTMTTPAAFDDKGNIKTLTPEEVKQFKGDSKLPGYQSSAEKAGKDAEVKVHLSKNKETEMKLRATLVVITKEGTNPVKKKKKK